MKLVTLCFAALLAVTQCEDYEPVIEDLDPKDPMTLETLNMAIEKMDHMKKEDLEEAMLQVSKTPYKPVQRIISARRHYIKGFVEKKLDVEDPTLLEKLNLAIEKMDHEKKKRPDDQTNQIPTVPYKPVAQILGAIRRYSNLKPEEETYNFGYLTPLGTPSIDIHGKGSKLGQYCYTDFTITPHKEAKKPPTWKDVTLDRTDCFNIRDEQHRADLIKISFDSITILRPLKSLLRAQHEQKKNLTSK